MNVNDIPTTTPAYYITVYFDDKGGRTWYSVSNETMESCIWWLNMWAEKGVTIENKDYSEIEYYPPHRIKSIVIKPQPDH